MSEVSFFEEPITIDPYLNFIENIDRNTQTRDLCSVFKTYLANFLLVDKSDIFDLKCRSLSELSNIIERVE